MRSVIQDDFDNLTAEQGYALHHIFRGKSRRTSEKYGYLYKLKAEMHQMLHEHPNDGIDLYLKQKAQQHYEQNHGNREDFIKEFGRSYL